MKTTSLPPLNSLRAFETSARYMSIKKASEELQVTPSAVSQQVKILETHLNTKLFNREANRLALTRCGEKLFSEITKTFQGLRDIMDGLFNDSQDCIKLSHSLPLHIEQLQKQTTA